MATIKHRHQSLLPNGGADIDVAEWNDSLVVEGGADGEVMVRDSAAPDGWALADDVARTPLSNTFTADQTIEGNLIVTGEINPAVLAARWTEQRPKIDALDRSTRETGVRTLLSNDLTAGMSLRHDTDASAGRITVGNYDTQTFQPLILEADRVSITTGVFPPGLAEHVCIHPLGGVTVGEGPDHVTDPGVGILRARGLVGTLAPSDVGPVTPARLLGRSDTGAGPTQELTLGTGLELQGTTLIATAKNSSIAGYGFSTQITEPPARETARVNAGHPYTTVTKAWIDFQNANSEDLYWTWMRVPAGSGLLIQDKDTHTQYAEFTTTGPPIDKGTYVEFPVIWAANGTALATQACLVRMTSVPVAASAAEGALETRLQALEARLAALEGKT